jgi:hypothetical protein
LLTVHALTFWQTVTEDKSDFLTDFLATLAREQVHFVVIGGQAVNAYAEPVVSLDLDLVVATDEIDRLANQLQRQFHVERFPHSVNVSADRSSLRVQIQLDPRYTAFLSRATERDVLGVRLPVACLEDLIRGKVWAASDPQRRSSKRLKDLADIARLLEAQPGLRAAVPAEILERIG